MTEKSRLLDRRRSSGSEDVQTYNAFDNPGLVLTDTGPAEQDNAGIGETALTGDGAQHVPKSKQTRILQPDGGGTGADGDAISLADDDGGNVDAVSRDDDDEPLSGDEILFRLRLAHIYGSTDWKKHLRKLDRDSSEDVHMKILDTLREQPIDIRQKYELSRYLRDRLDAVSISSLSQRADARRKHRGKRGFSLTSGLLNGFIGRISAHFGSHVASYFVFLKFLIGVDLMMVLLMFGLVTLPQIISGEDAAPEKLSGAFGPLSTSLMFYGAYSDTKWGYYDRPLAFFLTWAAVNVVCFFLIAASMYVKYRTSKQAETSAEDFPFSTRVFSSWDHTLTKPESAALWQKAVITNTKEMIREEKSQEKGSCGNALCLALTRVLVNLVVLGLLAGSGYLIFIVADNPDKTLGLPGPLEDLLLTYRLPLLVSALKMLVPPIFDQIIRLERWHPRTEIKINIARIALFYLASLVIFLLSMYNVSTECIRDTNSTMAADNSTFCCWENEVGEEVFKVVLIDLGVILLATLFFDVLRAVLIKTFFPSLKFREFMVASEVLDVIYGQSLIWLGLFFSPLLAAVGFLKLMIVFYFRYVTARLCMVPPRRVFRASRSGNFFLFMLLVNLFVCLFTMTYAVIELEPSTDCGPFKAEDRVYNVITDRVGDLPKWLRDVMVYVSTPAVVVPVVLILLLGVLYFKAKTSSYQRVISQLRLQLRFERRVAKREVFARARFATAQGKSTPAARIASVPQLRKLTSASSQTTFPDTASTITEP